MHDTKQDSRIIPFTAKNNDNHAIYFILMSKFFSSLSISIFNNIFDILSRYFISRY